MPRVDEDTPLCSSSNNSMSAGLAPPLPRPSPLSIDTASVDSSTAPLPLVSPFDTSQASGHARIGLPVHSAPIKGESPSRPIREPTLSSVSPPNADYPELFAPNAQA